jgi:Zn-dependent protease/predicted transcriptional regulator
MRSHIKLGRIFGIEIGIHYSWFIIAFLITFSLAGQYRAANKGWSETTLWATAVFTALLFFLCLLAHELSHSLMARAHKLPVSRITLFALGGVSVIEKEAQSAKTEFLVAIVGPVTSVVIGTALVLLSGGFKIGMNAVMPTPGLAMMHWLGYINIGLGVFNMLPGFPLDGGRVLRSIVWGVTHSMERATQLAARVGQGVAVIFILIGIYEFFHGAGLSGLWIAFIGWFLMQAASANYAEVRIKHAIEGLRAGDLMSRECPEVSGSMSVQEFVDEVLLRTGRRCFLVRAQNRLAGLVTTHEVRALDRESWPATPVQGIMKPLDQLRVASPQTPVQESLEVMAKEDLNQMPVVENGEIIGMLRREDILHALQSRLELSQA